MKIKTKTENLPNYKKYLEIEKAVCQFLQKKNYLKVDLPVLTPALVPESYLEVFATEFKYFNKMEKLYLTPSPELFLKRLLARGAGSCYYLGKAFRNSEVDSSLHSFEFNMLEYYRIGVDYMDMANELLELLQYINSKIKNQKLKIKSTNQNLKLEYQNTFISLEKWEKISVTEAFKEYAKISEKELFDHRLFMKAAEKKGYQTKDFTYEDVWSQVYTAEVEPCLGNNGYPTLIYDYPKEFAALAKLNPDEKTAQRFEFYIAGVELGDCYTELVDWREQNLRFENEELKRKKNKKISHPIDKGFIEALKYGLSNCAGIAIGFERLAMIFSNVDSIKDLKLIVIE